MIGTPKWVIGGPKRWHRAESGTIISLARDGRRRSHVASPRTGDKVRIRVTLILGTGLVCWGTPQLCLKKHKSGRDGAITSPHRFNCCTKLASDRSQAAIYHGPHNEYWLSYARAQIRSRRFDVQVNDDSDSGQAKRTAISLSRTHTACYCHA